MCFKKRVIIEIYLFNSDFNKNTCALGVSFIYLTDQTLCGISAVHAIMWVRVRSCRSCLHQHKKKKYDLIELECDMVSLSIPDTNDLTTNLTVYINEITKKTPLSGGSANRNILLMKVVREV